MGAAQTTVDGYAINYYRARMAGTVDLEDLDTSFFRQGEIIVGVFVAKVEGFSTKEDKQGNIFRTNVARCTDVRVLNGALKEVMVKQLGLAGTDTLELPMVVKEVSQEVLADLSSMEEGSDAEVELVEEDAPEQDVFSPSTKDEDDEDSDDEVWVPQDTEVIGRIGRPDSYSFPESERKNVDGPRTLPFVDRDAVAGVTEKEVLGRIGSKDKVLRRELDAEGWR